MRVVRAFLVLSILSAVTVGSLSGQEKGAKDPPPKARGQLPALWKSLGLTDDQKQKVYEVQAKYRGKIDDLKKQIDDMQKKMRTEEETVLTAAQKARLRELLAEKAPAETKKDEKDK